MKGLPLSADDALLARLQAPPDLREGIDALDYWRRRRQRLPWYRLAARREAGRMTAVWERRVRAALLRQRGLPATVRLQAAQLIASTWFRRYVRRPAVALAAFTVVSAGVVAVLVLDLLIRAF